MNVFMYVCINVYMYVCIVQNVHTYTPDTFRKCLDDPLT